MNKLFLVSEQLGSENLVGAYAFGVFQFVVKHVLEKESVGDQRPHRAGTSIIAVKPADITAEIGDRVIVAECEIDISHSEIVKPVNLYLAVLPVLVGTHNKMSAVVLCLIVRAASPREIMCLRQFCLGHLYRDADLRDVSRTVLTSLVSVIAPEQKVTPHRKLKDVGGVVVLATYRYLGGGKEYSGRSER